jgi:4-amino-4-deoxy-L-arabinose transferase-like glycosyltransferase
MKAASLRLLQSGAVLVAIFFIVLFLFTALPRLLYPYDLDFIEDSMLMETLQFARGQPVYVPPNADFNPHVYMPLFFWLGATLFKIGEPSLVLLRMISFSATLVTTILIYWIAVRESGLRWIGLTCAGLFLGGYRINGFWYEVARVDSLFVTLMLAGFALAIYAVDSNRRLILSAVIFALAAFTKQTGFIVAMSLSLYLFIKIGRRAWLFLIPFSVLTVIPMLLINWSTDGWFYYHIFYIGSADPIESNRLVNFITKEVFGVMAGLSLIATLATVFGFQRMGLKVLLKQPWLIGLVLAVVISGLGRMRVGGNINNRMPVYAFLCLTPAIWMQMFLPQLSSNAHLDDRRLVPWQNWIVVILILIQFVLGRYSPHRHIPTSFMKQSGDRLVQTIAASKGQVLVAMHPYYTILAGKEPSTQIATLWYVRHRGELPLPDDFVNRIQNHYYSVIISDESSFETEPDLQKLITTYYVQAETLSLSEAPTTLTGVIVSPKVVYHPK